MVYLKCCVVCDTKCIYVCVWCECATQKPDADPERTHTSAVLVACERRNSAEIRVRRLVLCAYAIYRLCQKRNEPQHDRIKCRSKLIDTNGRVRARAKLNARLSRSERVDCAARLHMAHTHTGERTRRALVEHYHDKLTRVCLMDLGHAAPVRTRTRALRIKYDFCLRTESKNPRTTWHCKCRVARARAGNISRHTHIRCDRRARLRTEAVFGCATFRECACSSVRIG